MRRKTIIIILSVVVFLVVIRILLPFMVLKYVNNKLGNLDGYYGHVEDIDMALIRGAYVINGIQIKKINEKQEKDTIPFFSSPAIDLSVEWNALFKGKIVGEIYVESPVVNFIKGTFEKEEVKKDTADFGDLIRDMMPLTINRFEIIDGQIHYIDKGADPKIDISIKDLDVVATNLTNEGNDSKLLPAHMHAGGRAYEGSFVMNMDFNALKKQPTFDMNLELKNLDLSLLNDFFVAYGNFSMKKGRLGLYTEFAAKEGSFGGYVKPVLKDLEVEKGEGDLKEQIWELAVSGAAKILENESTDQVATKIPINGQFEQPNTNIWRAVSFLLRNAFVQSLRPAVDNTINIQQLKENKNKTLLEKIFGNKPERKKEDDKK